MKSYIKWQEENGIIPIVKNESRKSICPKCKKGECKCEKEEIKEEGVNPTDVDSAGIDQDLNNTGVPFDIKSAEDIYLKTKAAEESDREYQKKIFELMMKGQDTEEDPTKGPQGSTSGGIINDKVREYIKNQMEKEKNDNNDINHSRATVNPLSPYTQFIADPNGWNSRGPEMRVKGGFADKHSKKIDEEK